MSSEAKMYTVADGGLVDAPDGRAIGVAIDPVEAKDFANELNRLASQRDAAQRDVIRWKWIASRARCGCLGKDCRVHSSYSTEPDDAKTVEFATHEEARPLFKAWCALLESQTPTPTPAPTVNADAGMRPTCKRCGATAEPGGLAYFCPKCDASSASAEKSN